MIEWLTIQKKWICDSISQPTPAATIYPISSLFYLIAESLMFTSSLVPGLLLYNLWCLDFEGIMLFPEIYYEWSIRHS